MCLLCVNDTFDPEKLDSPGGQGNMLICPSKYSCLGRNSVTAWRILFILHM